MKRGFKLVEVGKWQFELNDFIVWQTMNGWCSAGFVIKADDSAVTIKYYDRDRNKILKNGTSVKVRRTE